MPATENKVMQAVASMIDHTTAGLDPTEALCKVASTFKLEPNFVRRVAEAFNASRVLHHFETSPLDKRSDNFPLADSAVAISTLWPTYTKAASALPDRCTVGFSPPPDFNTPVKPMAKLAATVLESAPQPTISDMLDKLWTHRHTVHTCMQAANIEARYATDAVVKQASAAADFFATNPALSFERVEAGLLKAFGDSIQPTIAFVATMCGPNVKRASAAADFPPFDVQQAPYSYFVEIGKALTKYAEATLQARQFQAEIDAMNKAALSVGSAMLVPTGLASVQKLMERANAPDTGGSANPVAVDAAAVDADSATRSIDARAALNSWMANDPVISKFSDEEVAAAFNDISQVSPRIVNTPSLLRGWLVRRLELGQLDPFEGGQVLDTESALSNIGGAKK